MRIKRIIIENIRCFEHVEIDLNSDTKLGVKNWHLILGNNGVGKTTLLRCIALGLCDESSAAGLLDELYGDWIRKNNKKEAKISLELLPYKGYSKKVLIETTIKEEKYGELSVKQTYSPKSSDKFSWNNIFTCGYGSARRSFGSMTYSQYSVTDAIYTLFNYDSLLQNPELVLRRLIMSSYKKEIIFKKLEQILMLGPDAISIDKGGIYIKGPWGSYMPIGALGDGYQATFSWMLDLLGWKLLQSEDISNDAFSGIVLIDELEQHLHPIWQKKIIKLLHEQFPNIQFFATSHSPLCAIGTSALKDNECEISILQQDENSVSIHQSSLPRGKRVDQVLTSFMFGLDTSSDDLITGNINKYALLFNKEKRNKIEEIEFNNLKNFLISTLNSEESTLADEAKSIIDKLLKSAITEGIKDNEPLKFEINKQLLKLFKQA